MNPRKPILYFLGAIYGGPGLMYLFHWELFGAIWGLGFGLLCLWLAEPQLGDD